MKKVLVAALIIGIVILVGAGTVVVALGGVRALASRPPENESQQDWRPYQQNRQGPDSDQGRAFDHSHDRWAEKDGLEWLTIEAAVVVGTEEASDIVVEIESGERVTVGAGPGWLATQGFVLHEGDEVTVRGFWEDGEFKAGEIVRQRDGARIVLRDGTGRPAWAGSGRRASSGQAGSPQSRENRQESEEGHGYDRDGHGVRSKGRGRQYSH